MSTSSWAPTPTERLATGKGAGGTSSNPRGRPKGFRVHPAWWPALVPLSPVVAWLLAKKSKAFDEGQARAAEENADRLRQAAPLELPSLRSLKLSVLVEATAARGFRKEAAVSYLLRSERGSLLFDVGYGRASPTFAHNWQALGLGPADLDAVVISHLHLDHMGGLRAQLHKQVRIPTELQGAPSVRCYTPAPCTSEDLAVERVTGPMSLAAGFGTTGPLPRMFFFTGYVHEQSLIARVQGRGLVIVVGCGHPTVEVILAMARRLSDAPVYAFVGGLHLPVTASRAPKAGLQMERVFATGKRWNRPINDEDVDATIRALRQANPKRVLLSAHDSCDHALARLDRELDAQVEVLEAGVTYELGSDD